MSKPDFTVWSVRKIEGKDEAKWTQIGVAFTNKASVSIKLDALPLGDMVMLPPKEDATPAKMEVLKGGEGGG